MEAFWASILDFHSSASFRLPSAVSSLAASPFALDVAAALVEALGELLSVVADFNDKLSLVSTCGLPILALRLARAISATVGGAWVCAAADSASAITVAEAANNNLRFDFIFISSSWSI